MAASPSAASASLISVVDELSRSLARLRFAAPVSHVYAPLVYARAPALAYLERFGGGRKQVLLLGMNPGPFGMAQTGVPFGEVSMVRDWLGIEAPVRRPRKEHPRRPIQGFACTRSEVSGARLWGWARQRFGEPAAFLRRFFVWNYCPLVFLEESGRNRTPDKLPASEREKLFRPCDRALRRGVELWRPRHVIGVGRFAEARARQALSDLDIEVGGIPHPSPASPMANRGWAPLAEAALERLGVSLQGPAPR